MDEKLIMFMRIDIFTYRKGGKLLMLEFMIFFTVICLGIDGNVMIGDILWRILLYLIFGDVHIKIKKFIHK